MDFCQDESDSCFEKRWIQREVQMENCMEWYRFKRSKFRVCMSGFAVGLIVILIVDALLFYFDIIEYNSKSDMLFTDLINLVILSAALIWAFAYTNTWFGLTKDTLIYVTRGRIKGRYNINRCTIKRDYRYRRHVVNEECTIKELGDIRISVETEQEERFILKGTCFSLKIFERIFEYMEYLKKYNTVGENGIYMIPQYIFKKQLIRQSPLHAPVSWKTPCRIEFSKDFLIIDKQVYPGTKISDIVLSEENNIRRLILHLNNKKKLYYLGSTEDDILDSAMIKREIQNFKS